MKQKLDTLGTVWMALGAFQIVIALLMGGLMLGMGGLAAVAGAAGNDPEGALIGGGIMAFMGMFVFGVILLTAVPGIVAGRALKQRRSWSRVVLMILAALSLLSFPLGTAIGVWTLMVLLDPAAAAEF
jgi:hypothetical protein